MSSFKELHLEITNRCRLACLKCDRTLFKGMPIYDISLEDFEKVCQTKRFNKFRFSGTYGDSIYHQEFLEIIKIAKNYNKAIVLVTNGSGKKDTWWDSFFSLLDSKDQVVFSMDGISKDTVGEYRINFKHKDFLQNIKTMERAKSQYNINVVWQFIPMKFNEHEIIEAAKIAIKIGTIFEIKLSNRWYTLSDIQLPINKALISEHSHLYDVK